MDAFHLRTQLVEDYESYIRSIIEIQDKREWTSPLGKDSSGSVRRPQETEALLESQAHPRYPSLCDSCKLCGDKGGESP